MKTLDDERFSIDCDGCGAEMIGNVNTVVPPYAVDVVTFTKHEFYCSGCWRKMKKAVQQKRSGVDLNEN